MTPAGPKYYRSAYKEPPVCLRRDSDTIATVIHIPAPNQRLPLAIYEITDKSKEELDALCAGMVETTAGKFDDYLIAFYSTAKSGAAELHKKRQQQYNAGHLKL